MVAVDADGNASVVISDTEGVLFRGNGTVTEGGNFNTVATPPILAGKVAPLIPSVTVAATFYGDNTAGVDLTGAITKNALVQKYAGAFTCPVQGELFGGFVGDHTNGNLDITVSSTGYVTGTAETSGDGIVSFKGRVNLDGSISFTSFTLGGGTTWNGFLYLQPNFAVAGFGIWSNSGDSGTWTAGFTTT